MSGRRLDLAIAGCGDIAAYVAGFARAGRGFRLVACCDPATGRAAQFARRFGISHVYAGIGEMLAAGLRPDVLYLAVPHHLHRELALQAIAAGIPTLLEKPLAATLSDGVDIVAAAQAAEVKVGVNYQYRYDTGCYALARAAQSGSLGEIYYARCNLPWYREAHYFAGAPWHAQLATAGGGTLLTQGSHMVDVALWALGGRPTAALGVTRQRVFTGTEVEDLAMGIVEMASGALVEICSSMVSRPGQALTIEIYGSRGTGLYSNRPWPHVRFRGVRAARQIPPGRGIHALQRSLMGFRAWIADQPPAGEPPRAVAPTPAGERTPAAGQAPPSARPYLTPAEEALPVLAAVDAIYRSSRSGRREEVAL